MGYTHYWIFKSNRGDADRVEKLYQLAVKDCQRLIRQYYNEHGGISGYTAHCPTGKYGGVLMNGKGELAHEDFVLREHYNQNESFNFCKTARKPYDILVVACLSILKHRLGRYIEVSSDGRFKDWALGVKLAKTSTKLKLKNPIELEINENEFIFNKSQ